MVICTIGKCILLCNNTFSFFRDGRAQVSRKVIHLSEPNVSRRAPDKYRSNWYNRINRRSQGNRDNKKGISSQQQNRERNPNNFSPFLTAASSSSNNFEAVVKFGF